MNLNLYNSKIIINYTVFYIKFLLSKMNKQTLRKKGKKTYDVFL